MTAFDVGAKALYEAERAKRNDGSPQWEGATIKVRDRYRERTRIVLEAYGVVIT